MEDSLACILGSPGCNMESNNPPEKTANVLTRSDLRARRRGRRHHRHADDQFPIVNVVQKCCGIPQTITILFGPHAPQLICCAWSKFLGWTRAAFVSWAILYRDVSHGPCILHKATNKTVQTSETTLGGVMFAVRGPQAAGAYSSSFSILIIIYYGRRNEHLQD